MAGEIRREIRDMEGELAIPRRNGEPLFEAPWEARAFSMAVTLNEQGVYPWRDFSQGLAAEIAAAERQGHNSGYYERWLASLEHLVLAAGLVSPEELQQRMEEYASGARSDHDEHEHTH
jgi:nitrile hydratase accessory protein